MISDVNQYEYICKMITDRLDRVRDSFKLFLQLFSAIVGGSIWLSTQPLSPAARSNYALASDALLGLVLVVTGIMVFEAVRGWWGYREALSKFDGGEFPIPPPRKRAVLTESTILFCMFIGCVLFAVFNPFTP